MNRTPFGRLGKNFFLVIIWATLLIAAAIGEGTVIFGNYESLRQAFHLLEKDPYPLSENPLLGWLFVSVGLEDITLADLYAFPMACFLALAVFYFFLDLFNAASLWRYRREALRQGNSEQAALATENLASALSHSALWLIPIVFLTNYDLQLFIFRWLAGIKGLVDSPAAVQGVPTWELFKQSAEYSQMASYMAGQAVWGYLGLITICNLAIKQTLNKLDESCGLLFDSFTDLTGGNQAQTNAAPQTYLYGYDAQGNPVTDPHTPVAYDPQGSPVAHNQGVTPGTGQNTQANQAHIAEPTFNTQQQASNDSNEQNMETPVDPIVEVIGGQPGATVRLSEALQDKEKYVVDRAANLVYAREYHEALHGSAKSAA